MRALPSLMGLRSSMHSKPSVETLGYFQGEFHKAGVPEAYSLG